MTATIDALVTGPLTPTTISRLAVLELKEPQRPGVRGFFTSQLHEEGLTSNWFRALSPTEGDLERLNGYHSRFGTATSPSCVRSDWTTTKSWKESRSRPTSAPATASAPALSVPSIPEYPGIPAGQKRPTA
jgi:hypothetical protein